jgi:hypothetical protein
MAEQLATLRGAAVYSSEGGEMRQVALSNASPGKSCIQRRPDHIGGRLAELEARPMPVRGGRQRCQVLIRPGSCRDHGSCLEMASPRQGGM